MINYTISLFAPGINYWIKDGIARFVGDTVRSLSTLYLLS